MNDLMTVYRMNLVSANVRINLLIKIGEKINHQYETCGMTNDFVIELIRLLNPKFVITGRLGVHIFNQEETK